MQTQSYITFSLSNAKYGIDANLVREIFPLPELRPIPEMPNDIIGVVNLRGTILPVMHLGKRVGLPLDQCHLSDSVIAIEWQDVQIGLIVHEAHEVLTLNESDIEAEPNYGRLEHINTAFVAGIAKVDAELISLLSPAPLISLPDQVSQLMEAEGDGEPVPASADAEVGDGKSNALNEGELRDNIARTMGDFYELYSPEATAADRAVFQLRAENLRQQLDDDTGDTDWLPLAIFGLSDEYFGIDLRTVSEFINVGNITTIPCCPKHIIGSTNLRGEILVLLDVRSALNLSAANWNDDDAALQAVVVEIDDLVAGISVDEIVDVTYVSSVQIGAVPSNVSAAAQDYLKGTLPFRDGMLGILDLPKLLNSGRFIVDEAV